MPKAVSRLQIQEEDGAPVGRPITLKVSNGTLTDNGDGTFSLNNSGVAGGATTALDNLASVAINATLIPGTSDAIALGSTTKQWSDLFLAEGGVINWDNGDATITQTSNDITVGGITTFGLGTSTALTTGTIELGHASDTTIARDSAGVVSIEGNVIYRAGGTDVPVADGGTGSSTASDARTALGLAIGTDVQAYDADLTTLSTAFTSASATGPASLDLAEDTDNGTNKVTVKAPASIASDKVATLQDVTGTLYITGGTDVAVADGGTGASTAADALVNLGLTATAAELNTLDGITATVTELNYTDGVTSAIQTQLDTKITASSTDTLTNKTLTAPKFADLGFIADANGNEILILDTVGSAVNEVTLANAATGNNPTLAATGGDADVSLDLRGKGTGGVKLQLRTQAIDGTTNATTAAIRFQTGVAFIEHDATEASTKTITFPTAFSTPLGVIISVAGTKASGADPSDITDTTGGQTDSAAYLVSASAISTTGFTYTAKRTPASSGVHTVASWLAWGT